MRIGIFYFSLNPKPDASFVNPVGYVRCEQVDAPSLDKALYMANPMPGESVMNTHPLDPTDWNK